MIKKIDHINIIVRDLERAKQFFLDLGFVSVVNKEGLLKGKAIEQVTKLNKVNAYYYTVTLPDSQTNIELIKYDSPEDVDDPLISMPNHIGFRHLAFAVDDIEKLVEKLKKKKVTFFSEIQEYKPTKKNFVTFTDLMGLC